MKLYKSPDGQVYGYADDGSQDYLITKDFVVFTAQETKQWNDNIKANANADKAKQLLADSDWSVLPDVGLKNSADFVTYRGILRGYATQPVVDPVWPAEPTPVWQ